MRNIHFPIVLLLLAMLSCDNGSDPSTVGTTTRIEDENSVLTAPTEWKSGSTIIIDCALDVRSALTIAPGCTVRFTPRGSMLVGVNGNASLVAVGTPSKPILFIPENGSQAGSWYGITFGELNARQVTKLNHCVLEGGGKSLQEFIHLDGTMLAMDSCIVRNAAGVGLLLTGTAGFTHFSGNELSSCGDYLLKAQPQCILGLDSVNVFGSNGGKTVAISEGSVTSAGTLTRLSVPYTVIGELAVNAELTIAKGTTLRFSTDGSVTVGLDAFAALVAEGTSAAPIVFTSANPSPQPGDWEGIVFYEKNSATKSILKNVRIEYAGKSSGVFEAAVYAFSNFAFENSLIENSISYGVYFREDAGFVSCTGNTIRQCGKDPVHLSADQAHTVGLNNQLSAGSGMGIYVEDATISKNVRWEQQTVPYVVNGTIYVSTTIGMARLTLAPGSKLQFLHSSGISVQDNGSLVAEGSSDKLITFTTNAATPSPGDWDGLYFAHESYGGNVLKYCTVEYAGNYTEYNIGIRTSNLSVTNCSIKHSKVNGIYIYYNDPAYTPVLRDNTFVGNLVTDVAYEQ